MGDEAELAKTFEPKAVEETWYAFWDSNGYFRPDPESDGAPYCITIPRRM